MAVVGIAVSALPNRNLEHYDDIVLIESRGDFSVITADGKVSSATTVISAVQQSVTMQQKQQMIIPIVKTS